MTAVRAVFSMGDPHGIGPEVLLRALQIALERHALEPLIFGAPSYLRSLHADLSLKFDFDLLKVVSVGDFPYPPRWGTLDATAGRLALDSLQKAVEHCRDQHHRLLVTAPVNKKALHLNGFGSPGQTEFVAGYFAGSRPAMAFFSDRLHVLLATVHIPLREVAFALTPDDLIHKTGLFIQALQKLGIQRPRIGLCGLNPHASEDGLFGDEESRLLEPVLQALSARWGPGLVTGPFPADTLFRRAVESGEFDAVVALYHDQGLIPLKLVAFESAVNVTLGLPLVRTSPDHGTAFEIAGRGIADPGSMLAAIEWGLALMKDEG